jgi:hypothetical protein
MNRARWLAVLGCLCLIAIPAQAQSTVSTFGGAATDTAYTYYTTQAALDGMVMNDGPASAVNYFRLTYAGVGSTNNEIAFDQSFPDHVAHVTADFDFRLGGTPGAGSYADGMGFALLPVGVYGATGNGLNGTTALPGITEEGDSARDGAISIGLDTYDNGAAAEDPDANHISLHYHSSAIDYNVAVSLTPFGYQLHQDNLDDTATAFDHLHMTVDIGSSGGATVSVSITSNQVGNTGENGTTIPAGTSITPISGFVIPGVQIYAMRAAFGARTGGANDNADVANVNIAYTGVQ